MRAITLHGDDLEFRDDLPEPIPAADEVLVEVVQAGICETDLQLARGYMGFSGVLGHEFVGVARTGSMAGCRVVGEINCNCGVCTRCRSGLGNHCPKRTVVGIDRHDGAFAERLAIPESCLHAVPDSVSDDQAVLTEPLAAALQIGEQIDLTAVNNAVVLGDGRLSLLIASMLVRSVSEVQVVGKHQEKLERFERRGIPTMRLEQAGPEKSFDLVVEVTGSPSGLPLALSLVRPRGTVVMKTTVAAEHQMSLAAVVIDEIQIVGSRCGPFDRAINALLDHQVDVADLITHRYRLADFKQAMQTAVEPNALKVVFEIRS